MATKARVQTLIKDNKVMVFSKTYCPYCVKAKKALQTYTKDFTVLELESDPDGDAIQDVLRDLTGGRSVPRVFIAGEFLGGGDETQAAASNGSLQKKLAAAGAV